MAAGREFHQEVTKERKNQGEMGVGEIIVVTCKVIVMLQLVQRAKHGLLQYRGVRNYEKRNFKSLQRFQIK